jgi:hypothetical protein
LTLTLNTTRKLRRTFWNTATTGLDNDPGRLEAQSRVATQQTTVNMDLQAAPPTSLSSDDTACIDPQLLRLDRGHAAITSLFMMMDTISAAGYSLEMTGGSSDEAAAGRG